MYFKCADAMICFLVFAIKYVFLLKYKSSKRALDYFYAIPTSLRSPFLSYCNLHLCLIAFLSHCIDVQHTEKRADITSDYCTLSVSTG